MGVRDRRRESAAKREEPESAVAESGQFFKREGVEKTTARMAGELVEKELTGFGKFVWAIEVPRVEFITFAQALSALENGEPLMEVQTLEIEAGRDEAQFQRVSLTLHNIVRL